MPIDQHNEYRAALALRHTPGIGLRTVRRLHEQFGELAVACAEARSWASLGLTKANQTEAFRAKAWRKGADEEYRLASEAGFGYLVISDSRYPERLREIIDPPVLLYCRGRLDLLEGPAVAIVGSRCCSKYGLEATQAIAEALSRYGVTVVSGLADGIDRQAHFAGLTGVGGTIAVLGTGLDRVYPERNADLWRAMAQNGLALSEFAPGSMPEQHHFPIRNRIISGLSHGVLVAEAPSRSGALITARRAMEQGREVFAMPGPVPHFDGCIGLIQEGAYAVRCAEDILHELKYVLGGDLIREEPESAPIVPPPMPGSARRAPELDGDERRVLDSLSDVGDKVHIDTLGRSLGMPAHIVSQMLLGLEIKGLVRQWPGMYYSVS
jgi:DNA processing protein